MARSNDYIIKIDKFIGNKVLSLRKKQNLPRKQLAEYLNVTYQQLAKYEKGINRLSVGRLMIIAEFFSKDILYFLNGTDFLQRSNKNLKNHTKVKNNPNSKVEVENNNTHPQINDQLVA